MLTHQAGIILGEAFQREKSEGIREVLKYIYQNRILNSEEFRNLVINFRENIINKEITISSNEQDYGGKFMFCGLDIREL